MAGALEMGSKQRQSLEKFQKLLNLREPVAGRLAEKVGVADKGRAILPEKGFGISVEIVQADGRQDAPAKPVPHHFLAGIDAVDLEVSADAGQPLCFEPREKLGI